MAYQGLSSRRSKVMASRDATKHQNVVDGVGWIGSHAHYQYDLEGHNRAYRSF